MASNEDTKAKKVGYWVVTGLVALGYFVGGAFDLARGAEVQAIMSHLGYPAYFAAILGAWKLLGALAIVAPRFPRLKEWAYAGMFFDLSGAIASHLSSGDGARQVVAPAILLVLVVASWWLRPSSRVLGGVPQAAQLGAERRPLAA